MDSVILGEWIGCIGCLTLGIFAIYKYTKQNREFRDK